MSIQKNTPIAPYSSMGCVKERDKSEGCGRVNKQCLISAASGGGLAALASCCWPAPLREVDYQSNEREWQGFFLGEGWSLNERSHNAYAYSTTATMRDKLGVFSKKHCGHSGMSKGRVMAGGAERPADSARSCLAWLQSFVCVS